jgi:hypothetical protein
MRKRKRPLRKKTTRRPIVSVGLLGARLIGERRVKSLALFRWSERHRTSC